MKTDLISSSRDKIPIAAGRIAVNESFGDQVSAKPLQMKYIECQEVETNTDDRCARRRLMIAV